MLTTRPEDVIERLSTPLLTTVTWNGLFAFSPRTSPVIWAAKSRPAIPLTLTNTVAGALVLEVSPTVSGKAGVTGPSGAVTVGFCAADLDSVPAGPPVWLHE